MSTKRKYSRYFQGKKDLINPKSLKEYNKYLRSKISKNINVKKTTFKTYENYFNQFLIYVAEEWDNQYIYSEDFLDEIVEVLEGFIVFCTETLGNNKKVINTKLSAVSSFYIWAVGRKILDNHPFADKLERMKGAKEEKLIGNYFLNDEQIQIITDTIEKGYFYRLPQLDEDEEPLSEDDKELYRVNFDKQDSLIWNIALESGNRLGALSNLELDKLDLEEMCFKEIREKMSKLTEVVFFEETKGKIVEWLGERKKIDNLEVNNLFITKYRKEYKPMDRNTIYRRVQKMGKIIGLDDFRPHCIRKTTINRIVEKTGNLSLAQAFAGHESPETTSAHYVRPKSKGEIRDKLRDVMKDI